MTDAEDLARRYLALWQDYVTTLLADCPSGSITILAGLIGGSCPQIGRTTGANEVASGAARQPKLRFTAKRRPSHHWRTRSLITGHGHGHLIITCRAHKDARRPVAHRFNVPPARTLRSTVSCRSRPQAHLSQ